MNTCRPNGIIATAGLALLLGMIACGGGSSKDGGTEDAGMPHSDAGMTDGGSDAGGIDPHGLGMQCKTPDETQSDCSSDLVCVPLSPNNSCTMLQCGQPTADGGVAAKAFECADAGMVTPCGETEDCRPNVCVQQSTGPSYCARGCTPNHLADPATSDMKSCHRADFSCWTGEDASGSAIHFCFPDCRTKGNACAYGSTCDAATGECNVTDCTATACPTGQICYKDSSQTPAAHECVADCRSASNACPSGRTCNTSTGACDPVIHTYGQTCGPGVAQCDAASICIVFAADATVGECLATCTSTFQCNSIPGSQCNVVDPASNQLLCSPAFCTPAGAIPNGSSDGGSSDAGSSDAGSSDAGSSDAGSSDAGSSDAGSSDAGAACGPGLSCQGVQLTSGGSLSYGCLPTQP